MTTSTIGTGARTYPTVALWLAGFTTGVGGWTGQMFPDTNPTVITAAISFLSHAVSSSDFIHLTCGAGQSFTDQGGGINHLRYDSANGVAFSCSTSYVAMFSVGEDFVTITGTQAANTMGGSGSGCFFDFGGGSSTVFENCIGEHTATSGGPIFSINHGLIRNSLAIARGAGVNGFRLGYSDARVVNCTAVRPSDITAAGTAFQIGNSGNTVKNSAGFGFTTFNDAAFTGSNNCSDQAISSGSANQASKTYANQFVTTTDAARDFRAKAGADLLNNGATDTTDIPAAVDIVGTSRPQGAAWDIGAWELVVAAGTPWFPMSIQPDILFDAPDIVGY